MAVKTGLIPVLLARAGDRLCGFPIEHVIETMRPLPVEPAGDAPAFVRGLAVVRGEPVPVVNLRQLLGDTAPRDAARYVLVRVNDRRAALAVDDVVGIRELNASALTDLPPLLGDDGAVKSLGVLDSHLLLVLRAARLVPEDMRGGHD
jgi:purine-binding chemotaxis protein CheW